MELLTLTGVTKRYGDVTAVSRVDLSVEAGQRLAVIGPSGSGKTTLLRLIAGFEVPDDGRITLGEVTLAENHRSVPAHRREIGYVAQEGALFPHLTLGENIGFGLERRDPEKRAKVQKLMARVGLSPSMLDRRPHQISGGQQQRVALARALARKPKLMLLDEPFSALDAGLREAMRDTVGNILGSAGITTILVTHDQAEALSFADHLAVMRDGRLIQAGNPEDLYVRPVDSFVAGFLGEAIILDADVTQGVAHCALGVIRVDSADATGRVRIMLRPEQIAIRPTSDGGTARVVSRSFRGPSARIVVQPHNGALAEINLVAPNGLVLAAGATVHLEITGPAHVLSAP
jgi:iron(III) transport system ATP-binding protein